MLYLLPNQGQLWNSYIESKCWLDKLRMEPTANPIRFCDLSASRHNGISTVSSQWNCQSKPILTVHGKQEANLFQLKSEKEEELKACKCKSACLLYPEQVQKNTTVIEKIKAGLQISGSKCGV
ncbi:uncharacterized protein LOC135494645 isoform X2 [Lineus longissimus]|uniref:uncharacterized protein LOC135494645 isoform X2 n=1 Tax=Lineus longissimus TaxID=88925 RepID=UPI00315DA730